MNPPDVEKWVEAAALALIRVDNEPDCEMNDVSTQVAAQAWEDARIAFNAALRAAAADGFRLVRVPERKEANMFWKEPEITRVDGWNEARFAILASAVEVGE